MKRLVAFVTCLVMVLTCGAAMAVEAKAGDEVTVKVSIDANSDAVVATVGFNIPDELEYVGATATNATIAMPSANGKFGILATNPAIKNGQVDDSANYTIISIAAGELGTITFRVKEGVAPGTYEITTDGKVDARSMSGASTLVVSVEPVVVTGSGSERLAGDANGDGEVDDLDGVAILLYYAGYDIAINEDNADVNGDGEADDLDGVAILLWYAGYDIELI